ncbi:unannotated protein [freshwater metagenome]
MFAEVPRRMVAEPAQVDDALQCRTLGSAPEVLGDGTVVLGPLGRRADRVHQVERSVHPGHRLAEVTPDVTLHDLDGCAPWRGQHLRRCAHQAPHPVPALEQHCHQPATDVAAGPRHQHQRSRQHTRRLGLVRLRHDVIAGHVKIRTVRANCQRNWRIPRMKSALVRPSGAPARTRPWPRSSGGFRRGSSPTECAGHPSR